jgi:uncharacterized protein YheU (UPF0270 family)
MIETETHSDTIMQDEPQAPSEPVVVPHTELGPDLLRAVIESFVLREGTDYGELELSLEQKVSRVMRQLEHGDAQIIFDPDTESVAILAVRGASRRVR